jgi:hypothetical protein
MNLLLTSENSRCLYDSSSPSDPYGLELHKYRAKKLFLLPTKGSSEEMFEVTKIKSSAKKPSLNGPTSSKAPSHKLKGTMMELKSALDTWSDLQKSPNDARLESAANWRKHTRKMLTELKAQLDELA